jgi:glutamate transport system permease protein
VVLKDTSLGFIIGYEEILRVSSQAIHVLENPIQIYVVVGIIFVSANFALSKLAEYVQRRLARGRRALAGSTAVVPANPTPTLPLPR